MKVVRNLALVALAAVVAWGCEVEQTEEGELPDVDVQGGNMPEYDVDAPDVDVGTRDETVTVPDVDVGTEEKTIRVPDVDVNPPEEGDPDNP